MASFQQPEHRPVIVDPQPEAAHSSPVKLQSYTAVIRKGEGWWIGWVEEIPGVNSQGKTRAELLKNLRSALREALDMNREEARAQAGEDFEEALLQV